MIRLARHDDFERMRDIERVAGEAFRSLGMDAIADDDPPSVAELAVFQAGGRALVFVDENDQAVAYLLVDEVDGNAHVEQVSVHPSHARHGLGRELPAAVDAWAEARGLRALTLTTYVGVPWNAPYYERLGFQALDEAELTPGLVRIREIEAARGLARWPRVTMRRPLAAGEGCLVPGRL